MKTKIFLGDEEIKDAIRKYSETLHTWYTKGYSPNEITFSQVKDGIECTLTWNDRSKNVSKIKTTIDNLQNFNSDNDFGYGRQ
jgi:hypothetical protein